MTLDTEGRQGGRGFGVIEEVQDVLSVRSSGSWVAAVRRQRSGEEKRLQLVTVSGQTQANSATSTRGAPANGREWHGTEHGQWGAVGHGILEAWEAAQEKHSNGHLPPVPEAWLG